MKKFLRIVCCLTALCLGLGLFAACGGGDKGEGGSLLLFLNNGHYFDGNEKDSVWLKIEEETGVSFTVQGEAHSGAYYTKLSPLMNTPSEDTPDIAFVVPSSAELGLTTFANNWCDPVRGVLYSYEDLLGQYPEGTFPHLEAVLYDSSYKNIMQNGKHFLLPNITSSDSFGIYYRTDWLIAVGYYEKDENGAPVLDENGQKIPHYPETIEEFEDVLRLFTNVKQNVEQGVTLRGTNDRTYGLAPITGAHSWHPLYHAFGVTPDWDLYEGRLDHMYTNAKFRNFLVWANEMYQNGYIYPSFSSLIETARRDLFYNGQVGVMITNAESHVQYIMNNMNSMGLGDCVGFGPAPVGTASLGEEGSRGFSDWGGYWGGYSISRTCENTEGALKLLDFLYSPEGSMLRVYGIEGTHYTMENGEPVVTEENITNRMLEGDAFEEYENEEGELLPTGRYSLGSYIGGYPLEWDEYEAGGELRQNIDASFIDQNYTDLVQDALDLMVLKSSALVNFTNFSSTVSSAMNEYADAALSYVNSVIMGQSGYSITQWDEMVAALKANNKYKAMFTAAEAELSENGFTIG